MPHLSVILASAFLAVQLVAFETSAQPSIPSAFHAQVTFYSEGYQNSADIYVNYDYDQVLVVSNLGVMSSDAGKSYVYISGSGEYSMAYRYLDAFDHCIPTYGGYSFPQLNKLENATYARSHSFMGKSVDVYSYDMAGYDDYYNSEKLEIAYSTIDYTPVYLVMPDMYTSNAVIVNSFSNIAPSYSRFDLPYQCSMAKKSKITKGKAKVNNQRFQPNFFNMPKHI